MNNPREHIKDVPENRKAIAPYNFVELPDKVVEAQELPSNDKYDPSQNTGKIECTLTTSSPLYTRCAMSPENFQIYSEPPKNMTEQEEKEWEEKRKDILAPFFSYSANGLPVIPGSSLRGMLRTLVEIVSFSKIDRVANQKLIYRDFIHPSLKEDYRDRLLKETQEGEKKYAYLMKAGYIIKCNSDWAIRPAKNLAEDMSFGRIEKSQIDRLVKRNWNNIYNSRLVTVGVDSATWHPHKGGFIEIYYAKATPPFEHNNKFPAVLVKTGDMPKKKMECVIGLPDEDKSPIPIPDLMVQDYKNQITKEQITILNNEEGALKDKQPVFYLIENDQLVFFGHTMMFRLPYKNSIRDYIPEKLLMSNTGDNSTIALDIADAIFGWAREKKFENIEQNRCGRVSVSDGICTDKVNNKNSITPQILASPKPTTFQHYLVQPKETNAKEEELKHYASNPNESAIRGHKLYWHKGNVSYEEVSETNKTKIIKSPKQYTKIKPIEANVSFKFDIHFENLTNVELGALMWVLDIAQAETHRLKLGMGKPLGMGAVKITSELFLSDRPQRYERLFDDNNDWFSSSKQEEPNFEQPNFKMCFESYILGKLQVEKPFGEIDRIKMLLEMLKWPGHKNTEAATRYMEIEREIKKGYIPNAQPRKNKQKVNEYQKRPVLPTPLDDIEVTLDRSLFTTKNQFSKFL